VRQRDRAARAGLMRAERKVWYLLCYANDRPPPFFRALRAEAAAALRHANDALAAPAEPPPPARDAATAGGLPLGASGLPGGAVGAVGGRRLIEEL
jgi:hypothetical protein